MTKSTLPLIFCAIDTPDLARAAVLSHAAARAGLGLKLGLEIFNAHGPQGIRKLTESSDAPPVFLDLKYHDIPATVAGAVRAAAALRPAYLNVHASGGLAMMRAAKGTALEEADKRKQAPPRLLAVTVLTSFDEAELTATGQKTPISDQVVRLALLAREAGLDGVVCAGHEIESLRRACGPDFVLMVPGIRPEGSATNDQSRIMTPGEAVRAGATHLVIGRPITSAEDPETAARALMQQAQAGWK